MIEVGRPAFPYERIAEDLRCEILSSRREPGERLPSEHQLADQYGTSRPTVRRAIALLKIEGLVEDPAGPIRRSVARSVDDLVARMPVPDEVQSLDLPPGMPVVRVLRTIYDVDDAPLEVQETVAAADRHTFRHELAMR